MTDDIADDIDVLAELGVLDAELAAELAAPRAITEHAQESRARAAAAADIAADLLLDVVGGDGEPAVLTLPPARSSIGAPRAA